MTEPVNITHEVALICEKFGVEPKHVAEMTLAPRKATVLVFPHTEDGTILLVEGSVVTDIREFNISA